MPHWPRAVLFDFDGVIVNSEPLHFRAFQEVLKREHIELSEQEYYEELIGYVSKAIRDSVKFKDMAGLPAEDARKLDLLRRGASLPAPDDPKKREELAGLAAKMESLYGKGKYCKTDKPESCKDLEQLSDVMMKPARP